MTEPFLLHLSNLLFLIMYNVTSFRTDAAGIVYTCKWTYSNADGSVGGTHLLSTPAGSTPVSELTAEVLQGWLVDQLVNTSEEFDAQIALNKTAREVDETSVDYSLAEGGLYSAA